MNSFWPYKNISQSAKQYSHRSSAPNDEKKVDEDLDSELDNQAKEIRDTARRQQLEYAQNYKGKTVDIVSGLISKRKTSKNISSMLESVQDQEGFHEINNWLQKLFQYKNIRTRRDGYGQISSETSMHGKFNNLTERKGKVKKLKEICNLSRAASTELVSGSYVLFDYSQQQG